MKSKPKKRRRGRPSRAEASAKALAAIDLTKVDPRSILLQVAADPSAPASARVAAARALLGQPDGDGKKPPARDDSDPVTALALQLLRRKT
jgi:hypothetical protein